MMWGYSTPWNGMLGMGLSMVVWVLLIGVIIWAVVRWTTHTPVHHSLVQPTPSAIEVLRQRYARGEIDEPTFARMRQHLESSPDA